MSWEELEAIIEEAREETRRDRAEPPTACPHDGQPLEAGRRGGSLHCRFCGYLWPRDQ